MAVYDDKLDITANKPGITALRTYYAVETPRKTFWIPREDRIVCSHDLNHRVEANAKFCSECGVRTKTISIEAPSERFAEICRKTGCQPAKFFGTLDNNFDGWAWEWQDDHEGGGTGRTLELRWLNVAAFIEDGVQAVTAIGFTLHDLVPWKAEDGSTVATTVQDLGVYDRAIREVAKIFGIEGEPRLYCQVCCAGIET